MAEAMQAQKINYQQHMHVTAIDIDSRAVHMAYLQFSLLHIPALIVLGNALTLEERQRWYTPAHFMGMWQQKLKRGYALGSGMDEAPYCSPKPMVQVADIKQVSTNCADIQLDMFASI